MNSFKQITVDGLRVGQVQLRDKIAASEALTNGRQSFGALRVIRTIDVPIKPFGVHPSYTVFH